MATDTPTPGRCNARTTSAGREGQYCEKFPLRGADRCRNHGGASTGPRDSSLLEGNQHAVGNPGGGALEGNTNAVRHAGYADIDLLIEKLEAADDANFERACREAATGTGHDPTDQEVKEYVARRAQREYVENRGAEIGEDVTEAVRPIANEVDRLREELGL